MGLSYVVMRLMALIDHLMMSKQYSFHPGSPALYSGHRAFEVLVQRVQPLFDVRSGARLDVVVLDLLVLEVW